MAYRKFKADRLFDGYRFLEDDRILVATQDGVIEDIIPAAEAGEDIETIPGVITPGFINCHCHLELSHMKDSIPERTGLVQFLEKVMRQREGTKDNILQAIADAEEEMLKNGIVAVGDICNTPATLFQKNKSRLWYHNFIELTGAVSSVSKKRFEAGVQLFSAFAQFYPVPSASNSIVPHAPYSVAPELFKKIVAFPGNQLLTMHNQEAAAENEWFLRKEGEMAGFFAAMNIDMTGFTPRGVSSLAATLPYFLRNQSLILVHNIDTSEEDVQIARDAGLSIYWCLCPGANQYISGQMPAVDIFMNNGCNLVLGTDSLASNHRLDIVYEMSIIRKHFPAIAMDQLLTWATSNGAKALQMDKLLGSFEKGKQPGIVACDAAFSQARRLL